MMGRVAVRKAYGGDFELREYPVPDPEARRDEGSLRAALSMTD
jgi:hypothetical protein